MMIGTQSEVRTRPLLAEELAELESTGSGEGGKEERRLSDYLVPLWAGKKLLICWVLACVAVAAVVALLLPNQYTAETKIIPPQAAQSAAAAMLGQFSALAGLAGKDMALKNPADMFVGILKSRSIADQIIDRYQLDGYYKEKHRSQTRKALEKHTDIVAGKDGLITIEYTNKDPNRAAAVANAYVEQLYAANQRLAISEASQRRLFFEGELEAEKNRLADAEVDLKKTQEATGLIQLSSQADAIIRSVAQVQAQLEAKQVQLQAMRSFATAENPEVVMLQQEVSALRDQLTRLERSNKLGAGDIEVPTGKIPAVGLEYVRKLREVKYHEELFEILAKQYEAAKIDEGKSAPVVQVVDKAVAPDQKSSPMRTIIVLLAACFGFMGGCAHIWMRQSNIFHLHA